MVTSYDPKKMNVNVGGTTLMGFASDGTITASKSEDAVTSNAGIQDDVVYEEDTGKSGTVAVALQQTFSSLQKLRNLVSDRKRFALIVSDADDDTPANVNGSGCHILKEPNVVRGKNISTTTINTYVPNLKIRQ